MKAIEIENLRKKYKNGLEALRGINLSIDQGDFFALLGPNGAGKSTTIGIITTLVNKTSGKVTVLGCDLDKDPTKLKQKIGVVPQDFNFNVFEKVKNILVQQAGYYGISYKKANYQAQKYLELLDLSDKINETSRNLSGGMKRRLMIARALVHEPKILILDEPTAGVDIEIRHSIWKFLEEINKRGTTIILTSHYLEEVEQLCRNVAIIDKGHIITHTSIKKLVAHNNKQVFILNLPTSLQKVPTHKEFIFKSIDPDTIQVELPPESNLNDLFNVLEKEKIKVVSMRAKTNRIEHQFMSLINGDQL